jgi:hypothetical protein
LYFFHESAPVEPHRERGYDHESASRPLGCGLGIVLGIVVVAATAHSQTITVARAAQQKAPPKAEPAPPPASVHKIVVFDGPNRSVHYVTAGKVTTADRLAANELERTENALAYYGDLQRLKQQYVGSERVMEPQRRYVQEQLYGTQIRYGGSSAGYGGYSYGGWGPFVWGGYPRFSAATPARPPPR